MSIRTRRGLLLVAMVVVAVGALLLSVGASSPTEAQDLETQQATPTSTEAASAASCSSPNFGSPHAIAVGAGPESIAADDFNRDGSLDFAVANFVSDDVSVLIGDGNGGFAPEQRVAVGDGPSHVLSEDLDRDGNSDLVTVNQASDDISVLLGNGAGGFAQQVKYPTFITGNHQPVEAAAGDFNVDGKLDLAVAHLFNGVSVLPGDGQGGFHAPVQVDPWPDGNPGSIVAGDFNGNGDTDVAVSRIDNQDTAIHFNSSNPSKPLFPSARAVQGVSRSVTAGDLNRDGHLDLVGLGHSPDGNDAVGVALWQGGHFDVYKPQFAAPNFYPIPTGNVPTSVVPADFNGDGKPDLAVSNRASDDVSVLLGDGGGGFGPPTAFPAGDGPEDLVAGDFNGDGGQDLVVADQSSGQVSVLLNACQVGPIDLKPTAIEVTQAVQDVNNSVVLVEGKRAFARVHVATNVDLTRVSARLYAYDAGGAPLQDGQLWPANPRAAIDPTSSPDRGRIDDSFLFELPPSWTKGTVTLKAEINPDRTLPEIDYTNNAMFQSVTFQPTNALKVKLISYEYYETDGSFHAPKDEDLDNIESRLRREYPISKLAITRDTFTDKEKFSTTHTFPADQQVMLGRLKGWRRDPSNGLTYTGEVYLGVVADRGGGLAEDNTPGWNAITSTDPETAAHEVGHLMGRKHVNCNGGEGNPDLMYPYEGGKIGGPAGATTRFYGFDAGDASLSRPVLPQVVSNKVGDEMGYCRPRWISDYNYEAIREHIQQNFSAVDPEGDFLSIYGTIDPGAQKASLLDVSRMARVAEIPQLEPGPYSIQLFNAAGTLLAEHPFTPGMVHIDPTGEEAAMIDQVVDFSSGTRRVSLYSKEAGRELDSVQVSANPPSVSNVVAHSPAGSGSIELSWDRFDPDGNTLRSTILYSNDGGNEWRPIASGVEGATYSVESSQVPGTGGSSVGMFRVVVNDGVLTDEARSASLNVPSKPPQVRITAPLTGSSYLLGQSTNLEGVGEDLEDGTLEDAKLEWSSDLDGPLGTGHLLHAQALSKGTHHITLTATDSDGQTDTATVVVNVVAGYENPDPDDSTPPTVDCGVPDGTWHAADVSIDCTASDAGSGLANPGDVSFSLSTDVAAGTEDSDAPTETRNVCDKAGNCAAAGPITGNKVDKQAPGIAISAPAEGANYVLGQAVSADYACADGGSGVASCTGTVPNGANFDTSSLGTKAFQVDATDGVGNQSSQSVDYSVVYDFRGFFSPVDNPPTVNVAKAGSAVPVKFSLGDDYGLDIFAEGYPQSGRVPNDPDAAVDNIEVTVSAGSSGLSYDAAARQYTYVWKSSKEWAGTSRRLIVKLEDGTEHIAHFRFTR